MNQLSQRIKELRQQKNITQKQLSEVLAVTPLTIQRYECGSRCPDIDTVIELCKYFKVSSDYLIGLSDKQQ